MWLTLFVERPIYENLPFVEKTKALKVVILKMQKATGAVVSESHMNKF